MNLNLEPNEKLIPISRDFTGLRAALKKLDEEGTWAEIEEPYARWLKFLFDVHDAISLSPMLATQLSPSVFSGVMLVHKFLNRAQQAKNRCPHCGYAGNVGHLTCDRCKQTLRKIS